MIPLRSFLVIVLLSAFSVAVYAQAPNWSQLDTLIVKNKIIDARQLADSIVTNHPYQVNAPFNFRRAEIYYQLYRQSIEHFQMLNAEWLYESARAYNAAIVTAFKNRRISDAELTYLQNFVEQATLVGEQILADASPEIAYLCFKEVDVCQSLWNQINRTKGINTELIYYYAIASERYGKLDDAKLNYDALLQAGVQTREVYHNLATIYKELNDYDSGIFLLEKAVAMFPDDKQLIVDWVEFSILSDNEKQLTQKLKEIVGRDSLNTDWFLILGSVYDGLDRFEEAEKYYLRALRIDSTDKEVQYNLATLYYNHAVVHNKLLVGNTLNSMQADSIRRVRNTLYARSLPHFERSRSLDPVNIDRIINQLKSIKATVPK